MSLPDDPHDRDAHLLAALRHAPDRDAVPPPSVSAAILARAREQARPRVAARPWWRLFGAWRLPPHLSPHLAGAFGSVVVAALVGVMWSVNDPAPTSHDGPARASQAPVAQVAQGASAAMATGTVASAPPPPSPSPQAQVEPQSKLAATEPAPVALARRVTTDVAAPPAAERGLSAMAKATPSPAPLAAAESPAAMPAPMPAPMPTPAPALAAAPAAPPVQTVPAVQAAPAPPVSPAPPALPAFADARRDAVGAGAGTGLARAEASERTASSGDRARAPLGALPADVPLTSLAPLATARSAAAPDPLSGLAAGLDAAGASALWRHAGRTAAHGAAQQAWWAGLRDATRGRWTRVAAAPAAPPWLELVLPDPRGDAAAASLWLEPGDVPALVLRTAAGVWRAPLAPPLPASWQQAVSAW